MHLCYKKNGDKKNNHTKIMLKRDKKVSSNPFLDKVQQTKCKAGEVK
jgi:hypothetical protein